MLKTYDYSCEVCGTVSERTVEYSERDNVACMCDYPPTLCARLMCAPPIHTLETHFRGYKGDDGGHFIPAHGEYVDPNLCDKAGNPQTYSSIKEKGKKLDENGLFQLPGRKTQF